MDCYRLFVYSNHVFFWETLACKKGEIMIVTMKSLIDGRVTTFNLSNSHCEVLGLGTPEFKSSFETYYRAELLAITRYI